MINAHWPTWLLASIAKATSTLATSLSLPLLVEGLDDRTNKIVQHDHIELRVYGPTLQHLSKNKYKLYIRINLLFNQVRESTNVGKLSDWCGHAIQVLSQPILVYKYGDGGALAGCLTPLSTKSENIKTVHFGKISKTNPVYQSQVEGPYVIEITE
jgi:hypothetical protein